MDFEFELNGLFSFHLNGITIIRGDKIPKKDVKLFSFLLDEIGSYSARV